LRERVFVPGTEHLWSWKLVEALARGLRGEDDDTTRGLYAPYLEKYAREELERDSESSGIEGGSLLQQVEQKAADEIRRLDVELSGARTEVAARFEDLDEEQKLWGVGTTPLRPSADPQTGGPSAN
jgi:hypothetical protein